MTRKHFNENASNTLTLGLAQIAPVWLDREETLTKIVARIEEAAAQDCQLVVFGEALLPGYPFWVELTDGARFNSQVQKEIFAHYLDQAVQIEAGYLDQVCALAARHRLAVYLGIIERPLDRGGHSVYASLVYIDPEGQIGSGGSRLVIHMCLYDTFSSPLMCISSCRHGYV